MGNIIENEESTTYPQELEVSSHQEEEKTVIYPKQGRDAYEYQSNKEYHIGAGSFGNVFRATRKHDNHSVAIKESFHIIETLSADIKQGLKEEIKIMKAYPHPFIGKLIDDFIDPAGH